MQISNVSFTGIKYNKTVPQFYRAAISKNNNITEFAQNHNINISLREAHCESDNDTWKILKFKICKKGFFNRLNPFYRTIVSSKNSDDEILASVEKYSINN